MAKRTKYPLIFLYVVGISVIMLLSITILNVFNENTIRVFEKYVLQSFQKDIKTEFTNLLFLKNENLAQNYAFIFDEAQKTSEKIAKITDENFDQLQYEEDKELAKSLKDKKSSEYSITFLEKLNSDISLLHEINPYSNHIWIDLTHGGSLIVNPSFESKEEWQKSGALRNYFIDNLKSAIKEKKNFPIWLFPPKNLSEDAKEIIAVIEPIFKDNGVLVGYACIELNFSAITHDFDKSRNSSLSQDINKYSLVLTDNFSLVHISNSLKQLLGAKMYEELNQKKESTLLSKPVRDKTEVFMKNIGNNKNGIFYTKINHIECVVAYSRISSNNWLVLSIYPVDVLFNSMKKSNSYMEQLITNMSILGIVISIILLILTIALTALFFQYLVIRPIRTLDNAIYRISKGDFNVDIKTKGIVEISKLSYGVKLLCRELETYTDNLKEETRNRLAYETELEISSEIQKSILPKLTPDFKRKEYSLYAKLLPASGNVSGDFFDFFYVNENTLVFSVGDVSGKGIAAAFFMNKAKNLIKNECYKYKDKGPAYVLTKANKKMAVDNNVEMFLTMYLCFYDLRSGILTYANAGHHESMMIHKNGDISSFGLLGNSMLGLFEENSYYNGSVQVGIGDTLLLYTDGILDAIDKDDNTFGDTLFLSILKKYYTKELEDYSSYIVDEVMKFERGNRFDDITLLLFRRKA